MSIMGKLRYNITGLQEFNITFEDYCVPCEYQRKCRYGKNEPYQVVIDCKELALARDKKKSEFMEKLRNKFPDMDWETREKKAKVTNTQVFSEMWAEKVKKHREEILCLNSRKMDSMLTSQTGEEWWSDFREVMQEIYGECSKIM